MHVKGLCVTVVRLLSLSEALAVYFLLMLKSVFLIKEQPPPREWVSVAPQTTNGNSIHSPNVYICSQSGHVTQDPRTGQLA